MKRLASSLTCVALAGGLAGSASAGMIDEDLQKILDESGEQEVVSALVYLWDQLDAKQMSRDLHQQGLTKQQRHQSVVETLQAKAVRTQGELLGDLDALGRAGGVERFQAFWIANVIRVDATPEVIELIAGHPSVEWIYPNYPIENIRPVEERADDGGDRGPRTPEPGVEAVRAPEVWSMGYTGEGVLVANMDTGADGNHPALADRWAGTLPEYEGHPEWAWFDPYLGQNDFPYDDSWSGHGTHTLGTICGGAPGDEIGVAPGAHWISASPIDRADIPTTVADAIESFEWFTDPDGNPNTNWDVPDVLSNSWGLIDAHGYPDCDDLFWQYIDNCEAAGTVVLFSAGNEGTSGLRRPADRASTPYNACAVGATDPGDPSWPAAGFSSRGPTFCTDNGDPAVKPDIAAPGVDTRSALPGGGYGEKSGTSMASPHVNGVCALILQACPDLTVDEVKMILYETAFDLGPEGEDNTYGWGHVDAVEAVLLAESLCGPSPPRAVDASYETPVDTPLPITLQANDYDGEPGGPLTYRVTSLPADGNTVTDAGNSHVITPGDLPYELVDHGNEVIYTPTGGFYGNDSFQFTADDGGTPPEGGEGEPGTIAILALFDSPQILTTQLPDGYLNQNYPSFQIEVEQGQPELNFQLVSDEYIEEDSGENQFAMVGDDQNWNADDNSWPYALPFSFPYFGESYNSVNVSSNGFLDFLSTASDFSNSTAELIENARIAPLWDDWETDCQPESDIYIDESVAGQVTIRWDVLHYSCDDPGDFSVTLVDDGTILFHYGSTNTGLSPTIGVSAGDGEHYLLSQYDGAGSLPDANTVLLFPPSGLPEGMTMDETGVVSGTPTEFGTFEPRVRVVDALDRTDTAQLLLEVLESGLLGDINGDGVVDVQDLLEQLSAWGDCPEPCAADLDNDGDVDVEDLLALLANWT